MITAASPILWWKGKGIGVVGNFFQDIGINYQDNWAEFVESLSQKVKGVMREKKNMTRNPHTYTALVLPQTLLQGRCPTVMKQ